jgi:hypothetical protein
MDDCDASGSTGTLAVNRSERAGLMEGVDVVAWERSPQEEKTEPETSEGRSGDAPLGYSGWTALRTEQCNMDGQSGVFTMPCRAEPSRAAPRHVGCYTALPWWRLNSPIYYVTGRCWAIVQ